MTRTPLSYLPAALTAAAALAPVAVLVWMSMGADLLIDGRAFEIALNTVALTLLTVTGAVLIGVPLAVVTTYADLAFRRVWVAVLAAPLAVPSYLGAFAFFAAFGPGGEIETVAGVATPRAQGLAGATLVMMLYTYPFVLISTRAALQSLDANVVDAARTLGLSLPAALLRIVLPRAANGIAAGSLLVALYTLSDFATPAIMQLDTFTRMIYVEYNAFGLDRAALMSLQLLALVVIVLFFESRVRVRRERPGRILRLPLGNGVKAGALLLAGLVVFAALVLPVAIFGAWLVREGVVGFEPAYALNSAYAALLAAAGAVILALPVAYAASVGWMGRLCERATYLGFGIPGIVMGTALLYLGLRLPLLYQTLTLLVLAYVLRFLPLAVGAVRSSTERVENNLVGAARSLGATPGEAFRRVSLPLILPGIVAAAALVFLEAMRELPATLLLRPTGFDTLATYLWRVYEAGYLGRGAVPALALVVVSGVALVLMLSGEARRRRLTAG
ncbi:iron ABC transporter permease [Salinisphaera sp.]|uniref:ABC transporter permease n=1 Tax=Salinisphaera sp. TaxID=1914330 RepID=UPI000C4B629C|nr:iron ABC transporter permease [Salinisphaera sp.]MAS08808.1 ABC transporter permease [Salinisphaera sp.]